MSKQHPTKSRKRATKHAASDRRRGASESTQAGEYVREQMHKLKSGSGGKQAPKSRAQAIAIGLSEAREEGVRVPRKSASSSSRTRSSKSSSSKKSRSRRKTSSKK
jgi:hypothetical protein